MSTFESAVHSESASIEMRPALRGFLHVGALVAAIAGAVWLLLQADSPAEYVGGAVFATSLILLYMSSTTYHRIAWNTSLRRTAKRVDHAMIFVLIAGTYTPFCLDVSLAWGIPILAVVWSLAGTGTLLKIAWPESPKWLSVALYVGLGWVGVVAVSEVLAHYAGGPLLMLMIGGALYTAGGIIYAAGRPNPWPRIFGYHEIFHALVVAGSAVHYAAILVYIV
ncbi:MAG: hemolysin III family protein [Dehalococcoidia bacterium]